MSFEGWENVVSINADSVVVHGNISGLTLDFYQAMPPPEGVQGTSGDPTRVTAKCVSKVTIPLHVGKALMEIVKAQLDALPEDLQKVVLQAYKTRFSN